MTAFAAAIALGVALFIATNIDDIFVLLAFFADDRFRARNIVIGQYLGMGVLVLVSAVAALIALVIPSAYVGLLGLVPIALGIKSLFDHDEETERAAQIGGRSQALAVAAVTIANGGDNVGIYTPVFAVQSAFETATVIAVFVVMTALWCLFGHWLVNHPTIGTPIRRYGRRVLPIVLIGIGILILIDAGTLELVLSSFPE